MPTLEESAPATPEEEFRSHWRADLRMDGLAGPPPMTGDAALFAAKRLEAYLHAEAEAEGLRAGTPPVVSPLHRDAYDLWSYLVYLSSVFASVRWIVDADHRAVGMEVPA